MTKQRIPSFGRSVYLANVLSGTFHRSQNAQSKGFFYPTGATMTQQQADYITETEEALGMLGKGYNSDPLPDTQFTSVLSGVTAVPDVLIQEYGYVTALVWGMVRRYCQMADGVCRAAVSKIGGRLGMSERTIIRHLDILCQNGYLFDMTPDLRNRPHIYADTGKITIKITFAAAMTESQSHYDSKSHEESTTGSEVPSNIFTHYQNNIAMLTPIMADTLQDAEKTYSETWVMEAIGLAVTNNKRNWRYCEAILKRWKESGKDEGKGKPIEEKKPPEFNTVPRRVGVPRPANVPAPRIAGVTK